MTPVLQCGKCKFGKTVEWLFPEEPAEGILVCSQYPAGIPSFVEEATEDCPKFEEK